MWGAWAGSNDAKVTVRGTLCQTLRACLVCGTHNEASVGAGWKPEKVQWPGVGRTIPHSREASEFSLRTLCVGEMPISSEASLAEDLGFIGGNINMQETKVAICL